MIVLFLLHRPEMYVPLLTNIVFILIAHQHLNPLDLADLAILPDLVDLPDIAILQDLADLTNLPDLADQANLSNLAILPNLANLFNPTAPFATIIILILK